MAAFVVFFGSPDKRRLFQQRLSIKVKGTGFLLRCQPGFRYSAQLVQLISKKRDELVFTHFI